MMKIRSILVVAIVVLAGGICSLWFTGLMGAQPGNHGTVPDLEKDAIVLTVQEFWRSCLTNDQSKIRGYVTYMPRNFYRSRRNCGSGKGPSPSSAAPRDSVRTGDFGPADISVPRDESELKTTMTGAANIGRFGFEIASIKEVKYAGSEALLTVAYGQGRVEILTTLLLTKENGDWKIFMVDPDPMGVDPDYAVVTCE